MGDLAMMAAACVAAEMAAFARMTSAEHVEASAARVTAEALAAVEAFRRMASVGVFGWMTATEEMESA